jgi:hypothetical protein
MDDTDAFGPDACDDFLQARFPAAANETLRQSLLQRTTGMLRRRRRWKRVGLAVALATCYAAGLGTMWLGMPSSPPSVTPQFVEIPSPPVEAVPAPSALATVEVGEGTSARVLELLALNSEENRNDLYRLAGRRYVEESGDLSAALRCYRQYLDKASEKELAISVEQDDYLLMTLKLARQKEKNNG